MDLSNVSILNIMPPNLAADRNVRMTAEAFDETLREIICKIPDAEIIPGLVLNRIVNETLIDLLAWQFHADFYDPGLPVEIKKELVLKSLDWHYRKGTPSVVEEIVSAVFSKARVEEWYEYGGHPYRFRVATEEQMPDKETLDKLMRAINAVKNTRSFLDTLTQLYEFFDEAVIEELPDMKGKLKFSDTFNAGGFKFNGRVKHDGRTVNPTEYLPNKADGSFRFDGSRKHRAKLSPGKTPVKIPLRAWGGISDIFSANTNTGNHTDIFYTDLKHNGMIKANGSRRFNAGKMKDGFSTGMRHVIKHNGKHNADGKIKFNSGITVPV